MRWDIEIWVWHWLLDLTNPAGRTPDISHDSTRVSASEMESGHLAEKGPIGDQRSAWMSPA